VLKLSGEITAFGWGFAWQTKLKTITIPNSITSIGEYSFSDCTGLTSVNMPNNVTNIGEQAFLNCTGLTSIIIPGSVTTIAQETFYGCTGLTSVTLPDSVTSIGDNVFSQCSSLVSIAIPKSVTSIGDEIFSGCTELSSIVVDSNNSKYDSRDNCNAIIETATNTLVAGCKNTVIPNTVTTIGHYAFKYLTSLTDITIPNSVTTIDVAAFANCRGLITLTVPNTVTFIGSEAFWNVPNVIYNGSVTGSPWGAKTINGYVDCDFVYTDNTKTNLSAYVGDGGSVIIPNSVTTISNNDIFYYTTLTSIDYGHGLTTIPNLQISDNARKNLTSAIIRSNSKIISNSIFRECTGLTSVIIENGVTNIGGAVFFGCTALTNITIPDSVTDIGNAIFRNCTGLSSITIPANVTNVGSYAFNTCTSLTSITCNATTPPTLGTVAFDNTNNCPIYVPSGSVEAYKSATNWSTYADRIQAMQ
jgi:hypothetical protein